MSEPRIKADLPTIICCRFNRVTQVRQFERYSEVTSTVKSSVFNGLYDLEVLVHEIFVITHMDHKAIDNM